MNNDIEINNVEIKGSTKYLYINKTSKPLCINCYSKGIRKRYINHPIL